MRRVFGARTAIEAVFLIAVPIVALAAGLGAAGIIGASAAAYLLVLGLEAALARGGVRRSRGPARERRPRVRPARRPVRKLERRRPAPPRRDLGREPLPEPDPEPQPEPEPEPEWEPEPELVPEPLPDPEPEPEPAPVLAAVGAPEPEPARTAAAVVQIGGAGGPPRQWNVWVLGQAARDRPTGDAAIDEERSFTLLYLRDYADASGLLPVDFDGLVRETFGELLGSL